MNKEKLQIPAYIQKPIPVIIATSKKIRICVIIILFLLTIFSCKKEDLNTNINKNFDFQLKLGNSIPLKEINIPGIGELGFSFHYYFNNNYYVGIGYTSDMFFTYAINDNLLVKTLYYHYDMHLKGGKYFCTEKFKLFTGISFGKARLTASDRIIGDNFKLHAGYGPSSSYKISYELYLFRNISKPLTTGIYIVPNYYFNIKHLLETNKWYFGANPKTSYISISGGIIIQMNKNHTK